MFSKNEPHLFQKIDFSVGSQLSTALEKMAVEDFSAYLFQDVLQGRVGYGGYLEQRSLYERSELFWSEQHQQFRNIHLGVDFWAPAGCAIILPFDVSIHSYNYNNGQLDYGYTILVEAQIKGENIILLLGHLNHESILKAREQSTYYAGDVIGWLGKPNENGGWPPHLHLQVIRNLEGHQGDYPGICYLKEIGYYSTNCPNPLEIIKLTNP